MEQGRPNRSLALTAAIVPLATMPIGCVAAAIVLPRLSEAAAILGLFALVLPSSAVVALVGTSVLAYLAPRGRVPAAAVVTCASLPMIAGQLGAMLAASRVRGFVENAEPSVRAALIARGLSEALHSSAIGASLGAAGLGAAAVALFLAALASEPTRRGLLASVPIPFALAIGAGADALAQRGVIRVFMAIAAAAPDSRAHFVALGLAELADLRAIGAWAWAPGLAIAGLAAIWIATRARPTAGSIAQAAAMLALVLGLAAMHWVWAERTQSILADLVAPRDRWEGIALPSAEQTIEVEGGLELRVLRSGLELDGRSVLPSELPSLLARHATRLALIAEMRHDPGPRSILLVAERDVGQQEVWRALRAARDAGFARACVAVRGRRCLDLGLTPTPESESETLQLRVEMRAEGLAVCGSGGCLQPGCHEIFPDPREVRVAMTDVASLDACLEEVRLQFPNETRARVRLRTDGRWEQVVSVVDAALLRFPDVGLDLE